MNIFLLICLTSLKVREKSRRRNYWRLICTTSSRRMTYSCLSFYRDLAATMAKTSKQLQFKDIRIRDVGHRILSLWKTNYSETSRTPTPLLDEGSADDIMSELFGKDMGGIFLFTLQL